jgi:hypothetical protein
MGLNGPTEWCDVVVPDDASGDGEAREYMRIVAFGFRVGTVRYHQHWGENKIVLEIEDSLYDFTR